MVWVLPANSAINPTANRQSPSAVRLCHWLRNHSIPKHTAAMSSKMKAKTFT